jgi:hypothetical protein
MTPTRLRGLTDVELHALVAELEERSEMFDARTRQAVNDELRRRRMRLVGERKQR